MIGIVLTDLITGREDLEIVAYSVDTTLTAIDVDLSGGIEIVEELTQEQFDELLITPTWNHSLIQVEI
jgi:hypothetical protein